MEFVLTLLFIGLLVCSSIGVVAVVVVLALAVKNRMWGVLLAIVTFGLIVGLCLTILFLPFCRS